MSLAIVGRASERLKDTREQVDTYDVGPWSSGLLRSERTPRGNRSHRRSQHSKEGHRDHRSQERLGTPSTRHTAGHDCGVSRGSRSRSIAGRGRATGRVRPRHPRRRQGTSHHTKATTHTGHDTSTHRTRPTMAAHGGARLPRQMRMEGRQRAHTSKLTLNHRCVAPTARTRHHGLLCSSNGRDAQPRRECDDPDQGPSLAAQRDT